MTDPLHHRLDKELASRRKETLFRETRIHTTCRLNLSSNDYFQLRRHPRVVAAAQTAAEQFGTGSGASPLLTGFLPCHDQLLQKLLEWKHKPCGMLFNTGFMANQAVLKHLPGKRDLVLADRLIHHSVAQALTQGAARFKRYDHLDLNQLEELLEKHRGDYETLFVVTETVFSMDGDYPDLRRLAALKKKIPFFLILDEAHGTGVFGESGGGLAEEMGVLDDVDIVVGTLGKALASGGAYVLTPSQTVVDYLVNTAGEFIYSTFLPPPQAGAASAAVDLIRTFQDQRKALRALAVKFREKLSAAGFKTNPFDSPIVPVVVGEPKTALELASRLREKGIEAGAVRPPTVPRGTSRIRFSLHTGVTDDDLDEILTILQS